MTQSYKWWVHCPVCAEKILGGEALRRWDGLMVCKDCWEPRHPLDFYRPRNDTHPLPFKNEESEVNVGPTYVVPAPTYFCDLYRAQGMADIGITDCARADITL